MHIDERVAELGSTDITIVFGNEEDTRDRRRNWGEESEDEDDEDDNVCNREAEADTEIHAHK
ncbi:hypothetical protein RvY_18690 [Ramazzottius varieornatus]|uniref:Uncharacterized protein n=1 Tax=Ramazzottius varieornatus TaxID=947166 RepID=A0A1D1W851_RAMVA|nr:hypothetical protein RvY_18690 [Ramazzottius varieornatus]